MVLINAAVAGIQLTIIAMKCSMTLLTQTLAVQPLLYPAKEIEYSHANGENRGIPSCIMRTIVKYGAQDHGSETSNDAPNNLAFQGMYVSWVTYIAAVMKTNKTRNFFVCGRCRLRMIGIGSMKMYKSKITTRMPCIIPHVVSLLHFWATEKSHGLPGSGAQ
jgi:hypothetical protein